MPYNFETLRANIGSKSTISLQRRPVDRKFQVEVIACTNYSFSQKTKLNVLSYGIKIGTDFSFVLSQFTRLTDGQTEFSSLERVCIPCSVVIKCTNLCKSIGELVCTNKDKIWSITTKHLRHCKPLPTITLQAEHNIPCEEKSAPFYFCNSLVRTSSITTIFGIQYIYFNKYSIICVLYILYIFKDGALA